MQSQIWAGSQTAPSTAALNYGCLLHAGRGFTATETNAAQVFATAGVLGGFRVRLTTAPGAGKSWTLTVRKNGADTALQVVISGTATTGFDGTHFVSVAAGDFFTISVQPAGTPTATGVISWATTFDSTNNKESPLLTCTFGTTLNTGSANNAILVQGHSQSTTSGAQYDEIVSVAGSITGFRVRFNSAVAVGQWQVILVKNGVDTGLTATVTGGAQVATATGSAVAVVPGDLIRFRIPATSSPAAQGVAVGSNFVATTDGFSMVMSGSMQPPNNQVSFEYVNGSNEASNVTAINRHHLSNACRITAFYAKALTTPVGGDTWTWNFQVNETTVSSLIAADANLVSNTGLAIDLAAADRVNMGTAPAGTPATSITQWSVAVFVAPNVLTTNESGEASALAGSIGWSGPAQTNSAGLTTTAAGESGFSGPVQTNSGGATTTGQGRVGYEGNAATNSAGLTTDGVGTSGAEAIEGDIETNQGGLTTAGVGTVGSVPVPPPVDLPATGGPARPFPIPLPMPVRMIPHVRGTIATDSAGITTHGVGFIGRPQERLAPPKAPLPDKTLRIVKRRRKARPLKQSPHPRPEPITGFCYTQSLAESSDAKGAVGIADDEAVALLTFLS